MQKKLAIAVMTALPTLPILVPTASQPSVMRRAARLPLRSARVVAAGSVILGDPQR